MANNGVIKGRARPEMTHRVGCILNSSFTFVFRNEALSLNEVLAYFHRKLPNGFGRSFLGDWVKDLS
jgi:hypothetical protein